MREIKQIFIVGAGQMGLDIGQVFARADMKVTFRDISEEIIAGAQAKLNKGLDKLVTKGKLSDEKKEQTLNNISFTTELGKAADADLVLEAIVENVEIKKKLFKELDEICGRDTIFATNTSSISITEIASATTREESFIGMHFFNPATVMKLVEIIKGLKTSEETFTAIYELAKNVGKDPIEVKEAPGFVVNRILISMINEAVMVLEDGLASAEDIDKAMCLGCNHPMGPLALADLIGNDTCLHIMETIYNETCDSKYRPATLLRKMVRGGKLGRKTGIGFFEYNK